MVTTHEQRPSAGPTEPAPRFDVAALVREYGATANLAEDERRNRLQELAVAELALPAEQLRQALRARLDAFLQLAASLEPAALERIVTSLEAVMDALPGPLAMRRVEFVQTIVHGLPGDQQERLRPLLPGVLAQRRVSRESMPAPRSQGGRHWWHRA